MPDYATATDPPLTLRWANNKVVLFNAAQPDVPQKLLYPFEGETYNTADASAEYNRVKDAYEARKAARDQAVRDS